MKQTSYLIIFLAFSLLILSNSQRIIPTKDPNNPLITFGSCNKFPKDPNPKIFSHIQSQNPDVWIWVGDSVYLHDQDEKSVRTFFNNVKSGEHYTGLRTNVPVIGTWDDHDYGLNDGHKRHKHKEQNKQLYLDFLDEPLDSERRQRDGVYESYYIGDEKRVKVILLDIRYNRDGRLGFGSDMLGENQWNWLDGQLRDNSSEVTLIASGSQVLPDDRIFPEHWFDESRQRLFGLIKKYKRGGVILLSGDVHYSEFMRFPCAERLGFNLYEFTSSGLTHFVSDYIPFGGKLFNEIFPLTYNSPKDRFMEKNFGMIRVNFEGEEPVVTLEMRDHNGTKMKERVIKYEELRFKEEILDENSSCVVDTNKYGRFISKYVGQIRKRDQFVINYTIVVGLILIGMMSIVVVGMIIVWKNRMFIFEVPRKVYGKLKRKILGESQKLKEKAE